MTSTVPTEALEAGPLALPHGRVPTGWFQVAWSDEIGAGDVKLLHYFGEDIVLWRGESGQLHAMDAYCLHLGGNLGVQGTVCGDDIVCPWHAWQWNGEGRNTLIPYSAQRCKANLKIRTWPLREWYGNSVLLWHDALGRDPLWDPPVLDRFERGEMFPVGPQMRVVHRLKMHPQMAVENSVDLYHIPVVHGAGEVPEILEQRVEGHHWYAKVALTYGAGKGATWLTPDGGARAILEFNIWSIGQGWVYWPDEMLGACQILSVTPIDDTHSDYWFLMTLRNTNGDEQPAGMAQKIIDHQLKIIEQDFFTWENMKVLHTPNFAAEEAKGYAAFRRWSWQFYPEAPPGERD